MLSYGGFAGSPPVTAPSDSTSRKRLHGILGALFLGALLLGAGPGIFLINDYAAAGGTILGMPALYTWAVGWCVVEAVIVLIAYLKVWRHES